MKRKTAGIIAVSNRFLLGQKSFTVRSVRIHPGKYRKHGNKYFSKSGWEDKRAPRDMPCVAEKRVGKGQSR